MIVRLHKLAVLDLVRKSCEMVAVARIKHMAHDDTLRLVEIVLVDGRDTVAVGNLNLFYYYFIINRCYLSGTRLFFLHVFVRDAKLYETFLLRIRQFQLAYFGMVRI